MTGRTIYFAAGPPDSKPRTPNPLQMPGKPLHQAFQVIEPVRWKGHGLGRHPADRAQVTRMRTNLSMVFQQFNLWSHMTILQNVMEAPVTVMKRDPTG